MINNVIEFGRELLKKKEAFVVAKIVDTQGSTPRKKGAMMIVCKDGKTIGTIGGGILEGKVTTICLETLKSKESKIHTFILNKGDHDGLDMRCGGNARVSIDYVEPENEDIFKDDIENVPVAYIFGAGHIGKALVPVLNYVGFSCVVLDDREEFANEDRFPDTKTIIVDYEDAFADIKADENSYIIIATRGHKADHTVLRQALENRPLAYIGMIGSKTKVNGSFQMLLEEGFTSEDIEQVRAPIGMSIKAETPEEIAISIVGEIILMKNI